MEELAENEQLNELVKVYYNSPKIFLAKKQLDEIIRKERGSVSAGWLDNWGSLDNWRSDTKELVRNLLDFYSLLEIGVIIGFIPKSLNQKIKADIQRYLNIQSVKQFCFTEYKSDLPFTLLKRLRTNDGNSYNNDFPEPGALAVFLRFLTQKNYYEELSETTFFVKNASKQRISKMFANLTNTGFISSFQLDYPEMDTKYEDFRFFQGFMDYLDFVEMVYKLFMECNDVKQLEPSLASYHRRLFEEPFNEKIKFELIRLPRKLSVRSDISLSNFPILTYLKQFNFIKERIEKYSAPESEYKERMHFSKRIRLSAHYFFAWIWSFAKGMIKNLLPRIETSDNFDYRNVVLKLPHSMRPGNIFERLKKWRYQLLRLINKVLKSKVFKYICFILLGLIILTVITWLIFDAYFIWTNK